MPEINRLEQRKWTRQEPDPNPNPNPTPNASSAMRVLVYSLRTEPSGGASGSGPKWRGSSGRLLPHADLTNSHRSTSTSEMFLSASVSRRVETAGHSFCTVTCLKHSTQPRRWVSGVCDRGEGSGVCGHWAGSGGCSRAVSSRIC